MWSHRHGWHTVITELSHFTQGWPRLRYIGTRFRLEYVRCTHEYTWWAHGYLQIFAVALRIFAFSTRVSRKHYSYYVIDGSHTVCRRFWYCGRPWKSAVWAIVQNRGGCSTLQCCFFAVICRQQLKLDNMQSEDVDTLFPQSNRTQLLQRCAMELLL